MAPTRVVINYLPSYFTYGRLHNLLSVTGGLVRCNIVKNPNTGICLGYGFAEYQSLEHALLARTTLDQVFLAGKKIKVDLARPRNDEFQNTKICLHNLPHDWLEADGYNFFRAFGQIISCRVIRNRFSGLSEGKSYIIFARHEDAILALAYLKGVDTDIIGHSTWANIYEEQRTIAFVVDDGEWSVENLHQFFAQFGTIEDCFLIRPYNNGSVPQLCVVKFFAKDAASMAELVGELNIRRF